LQRRQTAVFCVAALSAGRKNRLISFDFAPSPQNQTKSGCFFLTAAGENSHCGLRIKADCASQGESRLAGVV